MMSALWQNKLGFTFIELVMILIILSLLVLLAAPYAANFYSRSQIDETASQILESLQRAQSDTAGQRQRGQYGVALESDRAIFFPGAAYHADNLENEVVPMPANVTLSWSLNGGGSVVTFGRGSGRTDTYGTITLTNETLETATIIVENSGQIYVQ